MADQETDGGPWRVPEFKVLKDGQMRCQVCFSHLKNEDRMRIHLKAHMRDAHLRISQCVKCDPPASFASTAEYMEHSKSHSSFVMKKRKRPEEKVRLGQENVRKAPIYTMYKPPSAGEPGHNDPKCPQCSFDGETLEEALGVDRGHTIGTPYDPTGTPQKHRKDTIGTREGHHRHTIAPHHARDTVGTP